MKALSTFFLILMSLFCFSQDLTHEKYHDDLIHYIQEMHHVDIQSESLHFDNGSISNEDLQKILASNPILINSLNQNILGTSTDSFSEHTRLQNSQFFILKRLDSLLTQLWDQDTEEWMDSERRYHTYNENGNAASTETHQLIDDVWIPSTRNESAYNENGNLLSSITFSWDSETETWINSSRIIYEYDENGRQTYFSLQTWDSESEEWIVSGSTSENEYDENGNTLSSRFYFGWNPDIEDFNFGSRTDYEYDEEGNQTARISFDWDTDLGEWVNTFRYEYTYDDFGNALVNTTYNRIDGQWVYSSEDHYSHEYDDNDNLLSTEIERSTDMGTSFTPTSLREFEYDDSGNQILNQYSTWNGELEDWVFNSKTESEYDENGNQTLSTSYSWDSEQDTWVLSSKNEWDYDEDGNEILSANYSRNIELGIWEGQYKYEYEYNEDGNITRFATYNNWDIDLMEWIGSSLTEYEYDGDYQTSITISIWDGEAMDWQFSSRTTNYQNTYFESIIELADQEVHSGESLMIPLEDYFSEFEGYEASYEVESAQGELITTTIEDGQIIIDALDEVEGKDTVYLTISVAGFGVVATLDFEVVIIKVLGFEDEQIRPFALYPNPTKNYLNINPAYFPKHATWQLVDLSGMQLRKGMVQDGKIDLRRYKSGIYIIQVLDKESSASYRLIKE